MIGRQNLWVRIFDGNPDSTQSGSDRGGWTGYGDEGEGGSLLSQVVLGGVQAGEEEEGKGQAGSRQRQQETIVRGWGFAGLREGL